MIEMSFLKLKRVFQKIFKIDLATQIIFQPGGKSTFKTSDYVFRIQLIQLCM